MTLSDNNPHIALDDIRSGLRFVLVDTKTGETKRGTFLGEPTENEREEHVVRVKFDHRSTECEVELSCLGLTHSYDGATYDHLVVLAEEQP